MTTSSATPETVFVNGVPRSGTTWFSQLLRAHSRVSWRYQPFFAYRFKDRLEAASDPDALRALMEDIWHTRDPFVHQNSTEALGPDPGFRQEMDPAYVVVKSVRYHRHLSRLLDALPGSTLFGLVRDPCATINSYLHTEREWPSGVRPLGDWYWAASKNQGNPDEYWGFDGWKRWVDLLLALETRRPEQVVVIQYEGVVEQPRSVIHRLLTRLGLPWNSSIDEFIETTMSSSSTTHDHSTIKSPSVAYRWRDELPRCIQSKIGDEVANSHYARFCVTSQHELG